MHSTRSPTPAPKPLCSPTCRSTTETDTRPPTTLHMFLPQLEPPVPRRGTRLQNTPHAVRVESSDGRAAADAVYMSNNSRTHPPLLEGTARSFLHSSRPQCPGTASIVPACRVQSRPPPRNAPGKGGMSKWEACLSLAVWRPRPNPRSAPQSGGTYVVNAVHPMPVATAFHPHGPGVRGVGNELPS